VIAPTVIAVAWRPDGLAVHENIPTSSNDANNTHVILLCARSLSLSNNDKPTTVRPVSCMQHDSDTIRILRAESPAHTFRNQYAAATRVQGGLSRSCDDGLSVQAGIQSRLKARRESRRGEAVGKI
jgi:hypothetical protein